MLDVCTEAVSPVPADSGVDPIPPQARAALSQLILFEVVLGAIVRD